MPNKYREYFDIDEDYFPQINDSSIAAAKPDFWMRTYPHQAFIDMLNTIEHILARLTKKSLWIEGAYGTGKSQCAFALKKILEVPEEELRIYWNRYEPLRNKNDLLNKLLGHKAKKIVTVHRYSSGGIGDNRALFYAVQESIRAALVEHEVAYLGENTLKESIVAWIEEPTHKNFFGQLLCKPEHATVFPQSSADEVLEALRKGGEIKQLMDNILQLADKEGINALSLNVDRLISWIRDVIDVNDIRIVFIWDEFSDYFKNNQNSLSEFQKLAELCNEKPFYFVVVTHESGSLFGPATNNDWSKLRDRFEFAKITLPDNIAFELIGHAFNVKPAAKRDWEEIADDLNSRLSTSRAVVTKVANLTSQDVIRSIMPIHPMTAMLLKNIAAAFKSNQRSMFDFIKSSNNEDVKAFQWFIEKSSPEDDHPLLTVDMLWNFFYERGKDNLTQNIRAILDTYGHHKNLNTVQQTVLKAILIMQAIDQRLNGSVDLFKATTQNLAYVFEGIADLEGTASSNIAKRLVEMGVLYYKPIGNGINVFATEAIAGDQVKIEKNKVDVRSRATTAKLVVEGGLDTALALPPALRLRYESEPNTGKIRTVTVLDYKRIINGISEQKNNWQFSAVIAYAKDEAEGAAFQKLIKDAAAEELYRNIVFIDATSSPLGLEDFEQYVEFSAMSILYAGNDTFLSQNNANRARSVLAQDWKNLIYSGRFTIYTYALQDGVKLANVQAVYDVLESIVTARFPLIFDFIGLNENQLKLTNAKASAKCGIIKQTSGVVGGIEKKVLPTVWNEEAYWGKQPQLPISKLKAVVDNLIGESFDREGQISIREIYDLLEGDYGFSQCNLSAFLTGFLLKDYGKEPYRYTDTAGGHETMTAEKLSEMIGNYIGKNPKDTFLVKMTAEEKAFYDLTERVWSITPNTLSSATQASIAISGKMRGLALPVWSLSEVDNGAYDAVQMYIELVQSEGKEAHQKAVQIGRQVLQKPTLGAQLEALLTKENCVKGMREYLRCFEDGKVLALASEIGAEGLVLEDTRKLFEVKHSSLWNQETGVGEIKKLLVEYSFARESNTILHVRASSRVAALKEWRERLKFIGISCEAAKDQFPALSKVFDFLLRVWKGDEILPDILKVAFEEMANRNVEIATFLQNQNQAFADVYRLYLEGLNEEDIHEVKSKLSTGMYELTKSECNIKVKNEVELFRQGQLKTKLFSLWKDGTHTKNPREWSAHYKVPILCCVQSSDYETAKRAFEAVNRTSATDIEIKNAITYLERTNLFQLLGNEKYRNDAFCHEMIGEYSALLSVEHVRDELERMSVDVYDWYANPAVKQRVQDLAEAAYHAGGSDLAIATIDQMVDARLKSYLKRLIQDNMKVGIEIIASGGE